MSLLLSLAGVAAVLAVVALAGASLAPAFVPAGSAWRAERWAWSFTLGAGFLSTETAVAVALGLKPGWWSLLSGLALAAAAALHWRLRGIGSDPAPKRFHPPALRWFLGLLLVSGATLYLLRALTEPMWSNDYLAIWGLKAKTIYLTRAWPSGLGGFSHPEYPLGLPMLLAGLSFLLKRFDDHALALLFPLFQVATLAELFGWLRRRGLPWPIPMAAAALLSQFEPLYSGFLTGMAEVPLSCVMLLFGTALSDCLDAARPLDGVAVDSSGAARRLAAASFLLAATKNEGLFLAWAGAFAALLARGSGRWRIASCALLPAAAVAAAMRSLSGNAPLRDFDLGFLGPRIGELPGRLAEAIRTAIVEVALPAWPALVCLTLLILAGRRAAFADRLLWLAAACLAAYLLLPALAVAGPAWLVRTTLSRTAAALAPLIAAGVTGRFGQNCKE